MNTAKVESLLNKSLVALALNFFREEKIEIVKRCNLEFHGTMLSSDYIQEERCNLEFHGTMLSSDYIQEDFKFIFSTSLLNKVEAFHLPKTLIEKLKNTIRYMDLQLTDWINNNFAIFPLDLTLLTKALEWTNRGKVDVFKTVNNLVNDEDIPADKRLLLSFQFCIEEKVTDLWNRLSRDSKWEFFFETTLLHQFWMHYLQEKMPSEFRFYFNILQPEDNTIQEIVFDSIKTNNILSLKFFWNRLSLPSKLECFPFRSNMNEDLLHFFNNHSKLHQEIFQIEFIYYEIQVSLENWLWQEDLEILLESYKPFLNDNHFKSLLIFALNIIGLYPVKDKLRHLVVLIWRILSLEDIDLNAYLKLILQKKENHVFIEIAKELSPETIKVYLNTNYYSIKQLNGQDTPFILDELMKLVCHTREEIIEYKCKYRPDLGKESDDEFSTVMLRRSQSCEF